MIRITKYCKKVKRIAFSTPPFDQEPNSASTLFSDFFQLHLFSNVQSPTDELDGIVPVTLVAAGCPKFLTNEARFVCLGWS